MKPGWNLKCVENLYETQAARFFTFKKILNVVVFLRGPSTESASSVVSMQSSAVRYSELSYLNNGTRQIFLATINKVQISDSNYDLSWCEKILILDSFIGLFNPIDFVSNMKNFDAKMFGEKSFRRKYWPISVKQKRGAADCWVLGKQKNPKEIGKIAGFKKLRQTK